MFNYLSQHYTYAVNMTCYCSTLQSDIKLLYTISSSIRYFRKSFWYVFPEKYGNCYFARVCRYYGQVLG